MCEDYIRTMPVEQAEQAALADIAGVLRQNRKSLADFNLPALEEMPANQNVDFAGHAAQAEQIRAQLNAEQLHAADSVLTAVMNVQNGIRQDSRVFYLDGPAGTGKTFTYNYLISELKGRGFATATAAFTGIAATLLTDGRTLHSLFKLPVPILETSSCNIKPNSSHAEMLRGISLFLIDEASMIPKHALHAIDRSLRDICGNDLPFGGKVILFGGDFRQVLPVLKRAKPAQIIEQCLKSSPLWPSVTKLTLTQNMCARPEEQEFCQWLLQVGNGTHETKPSEPFKASIKIPDCCVVGDSTDIVDTMYGNLGEADFASTVILTPTNEDSLTINNHVLERLPGKSRAYYSADDIECDEEKERQQYPMEYLNSITPSGMPPHALKLKVGAVVMLLRNLDVKKNLCNGTRLRIRALHRNYIGAELITGVGAGQTVFIPRITLAPSDSELPFTLRRRQFPVRLAYSMTINKSQGQTFPKVGLFLQRPCFSHGQFYVAFSRARAFGDVKVKVAKTNTQGYIWGKCYTSNIVYRQVLT